MSDPFVVVCLAIIVLVAAAGLFSRPKLLVGVTLLVVLFTRTVVHLTGFGPLELADDALVLFCAIRAVAERLKGSSRGRARGFPGMGAFALFAVFGILGALVGGQTTPETALAGSLLALKGVLFGWAVAQFPWHPSDVRFIARTGAVVLIVILALAAINAVIPSAWATVFSVSGGSIYRFGLPSLMGPFIHPFDLAFASSMAAVAILCYRQFIAKSRSSLILMWGAVGATLFSFRRKDILGLISALLFRVSVNRNLSWLTLAAITLVVAALLGWELISAEIHSLSSSYLSLDSGEARTVLTLGAFRVASEHFPFGAGFGSYGSRTAATDYSPIYLQLGFDRVYGLGPGEGEGAFLTDTSWPAILGEAGYFGAIAWIIGLAAIARFAWKLERLGTTPQARWVGATIGGWLLLTLFQSTGAAAFTSPPMFAFLFGLCGLGAALAQTPNPELSKSSRLDRVKRRLS